jgi:very-short-patch-repair endonuclease
MTVDEVGVSQQAAATHGVMTYDQLRRLGVSDWVRRSRIRQGQWVKVANGVVRVGGSPVTWEGRVVTHTLSLGDGTMASHRTAAGLWRLDGFPRRGTVELVVRHDRHPAPGGNVVVHRSRDIDLVKPLCVEGIPTTPIGRTLLDLGAVVDRRKVLLAIDDARRRKLIGWGQLLHVLELHAARGRDGVGTLRRILDEHYGEAATTDSAFERLVLVMLVASGLEKPELQHEVRIQGRRYRIDLAYPDKKVAIELDGQVHREREVWESDHVRQNALVNAGWRVLRFTWKQYRESPGSIFREVSHALRP